MSILTILKFKLILLIFMIINTNCFDIGLNNDINTSFEVLQSQDEMDNNQYDDTKTNEDLNNLIQFFQSVIKNKYDERDSNNNDQDDTMSTYYKTFQTRSDQNMNAKTSKKLTKTKFLPKKRIQNKNEILKLVFFYLI